MARFSARNWNNCATCEFWLGSRRFNEYMIAAETDLEARGICSASGRGISTYATASCVGWRKWATLAPKAIQPAPAASEEPADDLLTTSFGTGEEWGE